MGITNNYSIPYPELSDEPDGAAQMKAIADSVDALLKTNSNADVALTSRVTGLESSNVTLAGRVTKLETSACATFSGAAASNIVSGSNQTIVWTRTFERGAPFAVRAGNAMIIDCLIAGVYLICAGVQFAAAATRTTGHVQCNINESPSGITWASGIYPQGGAINCQAQAQTLIALNAGQAFSVIGLNFTGGNVNVGVGPATTKVEIVRIGSWP